MGILAEIEEVERIQALSIPAKRLIEKLQPLRSREEQTSKRWFWELLQNASDYNDSVSVRLEIDDHTVCFLHDGKPFSIKDVYNLISPDSGKDRDELRKDNIGKFGSGLVSTHILSAEICVKGAFTSDDKQSLHQFRITLNRSHFGNKDALIQDIEATKQAFKQHHEPIPDDEYSGFMTSFTYNTDKRLPNMSSTLDVVSEGLKQIYDVLPYTLAFMPKVKSVEIVDHRQKANIKTYTIRRESQLAESLVYTINRDGTTLHRTFVKHTYKSVETVFEVKGKAILPYPENMARLFCGLPMIGSETNGLPFIINSLAFEPTIEREGVEITPNDRENLALFKDALELYKSALAYIAKNQLSNACNLASLSFRYNGAEGSRNLFKRDFVPQFQQIIEQAKVVENAAGNWITVSEMLLPYKEGKPFMELYEVAREIKPYHFPSEESYKDWIDALDFTLFKNQKYPLSQFVENVAELKQLQAITLHFTSDKKCWLHQVISLVAMGDELLLTRYALLPNQKGNLKLLRDVYVDDAVPAILKSIHNQLYSEEIELQLLDVSFNDFHQIVGKEYSLADVAHLIDDALKEKYGLANGCTSGFTLPLNELYKWMNTVNKSKTDWEKLFPWFYPMRATLFMDTFGDAERDYAFSIVQSGKIKALAALAESGITSEELELLGNHPEMISQLYVMIQDSVNDRTFADATTGDLGEELVYADLRKKYPRAEGYEVVWAAKQGEPRFDFEVKRNTKTLMYVDAKTTNRGLSNSDSIPFFMRRSQWEFLPTLNESIKYVIARVFKGDGSIYYLQVSVN